MGAKEYSSASSTRQEAVGDARNKVGSVAVVIERRCVGDVSHPFMAVHLNGLMIKSTESLVYQ